MISLTAEECRVLGVLVEKELTTPEQYPLTLNALVNGANQRNNRDPVVSFEEDQVYDAVESLRSKGLVIRVDQAHARVPKYKHAIPEKLGINRYELVILAELLLRGAQTLGELRGRASRMHHLDSLEVVQQMLGQLMSRPEPLVRQLAPAPGSRAERYVQLLDPTAADAAGCSASAEVQTAQEPSSAGPTLRERVEDLERQVAKLSAALRKLAAGLGEGDPLE